MSSQLFFGLFCESAFSHNDHIVGVYASVFFVSKFNTQAAF